MIIVDFTTLPFKPIPIGADLIVVADSDDNHRLKYTYLPLGGGGGGGGSSFIDSDTIDVTAVGVGVARADVNDGSITPTKLSFVPATFDELTTHIDNVSNPHAVTKAQVGLGSVVNVDTTQRSNHTGTQLASTISDFAEAVDDRVGALVVAGSNITISYNDVANTFTINSSAGGTSYTPVDTATIDLTIAGANLSADVKDNSIGIGKLSFDPATQAEFDAHTSNVSNPHSVTKAQVGLGNVPNTDATARANHTGTQLANTISNFDTQVRTNRLDQMAVPTASVSMNSQKITSLLDPTSAQDAASKNYVDTKTGFTPQFVSVNKNSTDQTGIAASTYTKVTFANEVSDTSNVFDSATNHRYTPGRATKALITGQLLLTSGGTPTAGNIAVVALYKNGAVISQASDSFTTNAGGTATIRFSFIAESLNTTDYFEIYVWQNTSTTATVTGVTTNTYLQIYELPSGGLKGDQGIPGVSGPPIISRYTRATSQSIPHATPTVFVWDNTPVFSSTNPVTYNSSTGVFTVNSNFTGSYLRIDARIFYLNTSAGRRGLSISKNSGTTIASVESPQTTSQHQTLSINDVFTFAVGDTFVISLYQESAGSVALSTITDSIGIYNSVTISQAQGGSQGPAGPSGAAGPAIAGKYSLTGSNLTVPTATDTTIVWNNTDFVSSTAPVSVNTTTGVMTVNSGFTADYLRINAYVRWNTGSATGRRYISLVKNNVVMFTSEDQPGTTTYPTNIISTLINSAPGDQFKVLAYQDSGSSVVVLAGINTHITVSVEQGGPQGPQGPSGVAGPPIVVKYGRTTNQAIAASANVPVIFDATPLSTSGTNPITHNAALGTFTVNSNITSPYLRVNFKVLWANISSSTLRYMYVTKNGVTIGYSEAGAGAYGHYMSNSFEDVVPVVVGDVFQVLVTQGSGGSVNLTGNANGTYIAASFATEQGGQIGPAGPSGAAGPALVSSYTASANQSIPNNDTSTAARIIYNTNLLSSTINPVALNPTTGVFTVNSGFSITGGIRVSGQVRWTAIATGRKGSGIYKNGVLQVFSENTIGDGNPTTTFNKVIPAVAGDQFHIQGFQTSGSALSTLGDAAGIHTHVEFEVVQGGPAGPAGDVGTTRFIGQVTAAGSETSLTLPFPSGVGRNIIIKGTARSNSATAGAEDLILRLNSDSTAANYQQQTLYGSVTSAAAVAANTTAGATIGALPRSTRAAGVFGSVEATIYNYQSTAFHKEIIAQSHRQDLSDNTSAALFFNGIRWANTAAVTSLTLVNISGASFAAGSTFAVYVEVDAMSGEGLVANTLSPAQPLLLSGNTLSVLEASASNTGVLSQTQYNKIVTPTRARVYRSTTQSIPTITYTAISFSNARYNTNNLWSAGAPTRFTIPTGESGLWHFGSAIMLGASSSAGSVRFVGIRLNGNNTYLLGIVGQVPSATVTHYFNPSTTYYMNAGDYVELMVYQDSGTSMTAGFAGSSETYTSDFWGYRISD